MCTRTQSSLHHGLKWLAQRWTVRVATAHAQTLQTQISHWCIQSRQWRSLGCSSHHHCKKHRNGFKICQETWTSAFTNQLHHTRQNRVLISSTTTEMAWFHSSSQVNSIKCFMNLLTREIANIWWVLYMVKSINISNIAATSLRYETAKKLYVKLSSHTLTFGYDTKEEYYED